MTEIPDCICPLDKLIADPAGDKFLVSVCHEEDSAAVFLDVNGAVELARALAQFLRDHG